MARVSLGNTVDGIDNDKLIFPEDVVLKISGKRVRMSEAINSIYPVFKTFDIDERILFLNIVNSYLKDFDKDNLSFTDLDDLFSLASNKVFEYRLLQEEADSSVFTKIEKLKKQSEVIKESLATRRKDRLKDVSKTGVTILDIAAEFDAAQAKAKAKREKKRLAKVAKKVKEDSYVGNKNDMEVAK